MLRSRWVGKSCCLHTLFTVLRHVKSASGRLVPLSHSEWLAESPTHRAMSGTGIFGPLVSRK